MPVNNAKIFNAALAGASAGMIRSASGSLPSNVAADYNQIAAESNAFATEVDSLVAPIVGGPTDAQVEMVYGYSFLIFAFDFVPWGSVVAADYTRLAGIVTAALTTVNADAIPVLAPMSFTEVNDLVPIPEIVANGSNHKTAITNFRGGSFWLQRDANLSKIIAEISTFAVAGQGIVAIYQNPGGLVDNSVPLIATAKFAVAGNGVMTVTFDQGTVSFSEGLCWILYGSTSGTFDYSTYQNSGFAILNSPTNCPNGVHPITFDTNILVTVTPPATFNPLKAGPDVVTNDDSFQVQCRLTT